jgi:cobalt-zinc-cadmium efflux system outer membrane protein
MYKNLICAIGVYLYSFALNAQSNDIERVLLEIEQNNKELLAFAFLMESRQLDLKASNNLPALQAGAYYLPFGNHNTGDYSEFQVTQSFEFPTVYSARNSLIEKQKKEIALEYALKRQEVLLQVKKYCLELVYLNKRKSVEQERALQAKQVFDQVQELFAIEQISVLEVNKAKIFWMQEQFKVEQIESDQKNKLLSLSQLNGGNEIVFNQSVFEENQNFETLESVWKTRQLLDPSIKILKVQENVAEHQIKLSKTKTLPNLTVGFNSQGVSNERFSGVYGGVSIPLWSKRNRIKAAEARYQYQQSFSKIESSIAFVEFQKQYNEYQVLQSKFQEYQSTLFGLNSETLLLEAYVLGELSFLAYYMELNFYRQAYDAMLEMEKQLNQRKAEILKHEL